MKKIYDLLKYIIYGNVLIIVGKTLCDYLYFSMHPEKYIYYSAPWYTGALIYGMACFVIMIVCLLLRMILYKHMKHKKDK